MKTSLLDNPTHYRLPWTRLQNAPAWLRAEVVATSFNVVTGQPVKWCVRDGACVLSKDDNDWEIEPNPSDRDQIFLARTRWDTAEQAAEAARQHFENL